MDYVRQELLRQGAVLAALLGGGEETRQENTERRDAEKADTGSGPGLRRGGAAAETFPAGRVEEWNTAALAGGGTAGQADTGGQRQLPASVEKETAGAGRRRRVPEGEDRTEDGGWGEAPAAAGGRFSGPAGVSEMGFPAFAGTGGAVFGGVRRWPGSGGGRSAAAAEARAVSRAVERDARRYDGGFSIY